MKHKILLLLFLHIAATYAQAQQVAPYILNAAGVSATATGVTLEYSLGGFHTTTVQTSSFMYTQDFIQPNAGTTTGSGGVYVNDVRLQDYLLLDNAGTTFTNGNAMLEFSLGEMKSVTYTNANNILTQGILQPYKTATALPVTQLEFFAKRVSNTTVQLDWKTVQESNNKGFHIERKKENENLFTPIQFIASQAPNGNSNFPLNYTKTDGNTFRGQTYYRLRQEDTDGRSTYSLIRIVSGEVNKQTALQVWPVPSSGPVNVVVSGLIKPDVLLVYDISGKLVLQKPIQDNTPLQLTTLTSGSYFIRLAGNKDLLQKIIVQ